MTTTTPPPSFSVARVDLRKLDAGTLRKYCLAFRIPIHAGSSLNEMVQAATRHFEGELEAKEDEVLPAFEEYILTYNGGNVLEDIRKTRTKEVNKRARKRTRRAGETSGEEDNIEEPDAQQAVSRERIWRRRSNEKKN